MLSSNDKEPINLKIHIARNVTPYSQGHLDGLCGLYSAINAIRIARFPLKPMLDRDCYKLFDICLANLSKDGNLAEYVAEGMGWRYVSRLTNLVCKLSSTDNHHFFVDKPKRTFDHNDRLQWVIRQLKQKRPIIMHLDRHDHYSVVTGVSSQRWYLFDSSSGHWSMRSNRDLKRIMAIAT